MGIGFAIPVNMAKAIYDQLVESGSVVRGFLGVNIQDLTAAFAPHFGLDKDTKGVLVPDVIEDSAADKAGLKQGDVIVEFDGQPVEKVNKLLNRVAVLKPGTKVKVVVLRDGKRKTLTVELGERPPEGRIAAAPSEEAIEKLGFAVQELTDDLAERFGYQSQRGVVVTEVEPGSEAARKGITVGMLIMEVNRTQVSNTKEFNKEMKKADKEGAVMLLIKDRYGTRFVVLILPGK